MLDKDEILKKLHSMNSDTVASIVKQSLLDAGIELRDDVNGIVGFSLIDERRCENCGRLDGWNGCGEYVEDCMQDYDAYSNWIPKDN